MLQSSGKRSVSIQRLQESLGITITLSSVGLIYNLSDSLDILRREPYLPCFHVFFEVLYGGAIVGLVHDAISIRDIPEVWWYRG